jgi:hypothetical protein
MYHISGQHHSGLPQPQEVTQVYNTEVRNRFARAAIVARVIQRLIMPLIQLWYIFHFVQLATKLVEEERTVVTLAIQQLSSDWLYASMLNNCCAPGFTFGRGEQTTLRVTC